MAYPFSNFSKAPVVMDQGHRDALNNSSLLAANNSKDPTIPVPNGVEKPRVRYEDKNCSKQRISLLDILIVERKNKFLLEKGNHLPIGESKVQHFFARF